MSYVRALPCATVSQLRAWAALQKTGVKFTHTLTFAASSQQGRKPATAFIRCHINAEQQAPRFSTSAAFWKLSQGQGHGLSSPRGRRRHWLGTVALGAALGVSTAALIQSLCTGTFAAMALKVNLNSAEGDWKETKGESSPLSYECILSELFLL